MRQHQFDGCLPSGKSSAIRPALCVGSQTYTSLRQAYGSSPFMRTDRISLITAVACRIPHKQHAPNQLLRLMILVRLLPGED